MPRNSITFLNITDKTQTEFEGFAKKLIYDDIGIRDNIKNVHKKHTLIELLKRHPDFIQKTQNMINIKIRRNILNTLAFEIIIINTDLSETDIS